MKTLGETISLIGLYILWSGSFGQPRQFFDWSVFWTQLAIALPIIMVGYSLSAAADEKEQSQKNTLAQNLLDKINSNEPAPDFALYLRPFSVDGELELDQSHLNIFNYELYDRPGSDTIERILSDAIKETYPLVGLGDNQSLLGAGLAKTHDDWKATIHAAIKSAKLIFTIPSASDGTLWEIKEIIATEALDKTIMIMPSTRWLIYKSGNYSTTWEAARERISEACGATIPAYDPIGGIFQLGIDGRVVKFEKTNFPLEPSKLARLFNKILEG